jgi:hypothetical protein
MDKETSDVFQLKRSRWLTLSGAARGLLYLMGAVWVGFGLYSLVKTMQGSNSPAGMGWIISALMFVNAFFFFWIGWGLGKQIKFFFYIALLFLVGNILLTIADEFGIFDFITLLIAIVIFVLLILERRKYLAAGKL